MKIKPLYDNVVISPEKESEKTSFGIILPGSDKEQKQIGKVIAVGSGKKEQPMNVKIGDRVIFPQYAGDEVEVDGEKYKVVSEERILGIITE